MYWAHSANKEGKRQDLICHLRSVAEAARSFAGTFGGDDLAYYAGLWHDVGKFTPGFQEYLAACAAEPDVRRRGPDHKAAGAALAKQYMGTAALVIQGHHGGLQAPSGGKQSFQIWLQERGTDQAIGEALRLAHNALPDLKPGVALPIPERISKDKLAAELFLRMLFSALVDADFLDTEEHFYPERSELRPVQATFEDLWRRFEEDQLRFAQAPDTPVNRVRREVYEACLRAAELPPGLFSLAVPTGGGKTRAAMAFALRHALRHGHQRVIVPVPFITITEQTADTYRNIFGSDANSRPLVLEHHSAVEEGGAEEDFHPERVWARLASDNWDAPIIVTTTVQLFESLFSNKTSRSRKLHRLARSVIILDEAQSLPAHLLRPILDALRQLCQHYGTTVVLSTATQPAFESLPEFASLPARDIVANAPRHFQSLQRVTYEWRTDPPLAWPEVAELMHSERQALAVVNTKKDALALLDALDDPHALHLSTLLCGAHRRKLIGTPHNPGEVARRLKKGEPCSLVATQVVEAGVDLDFPLVLRALGPMDGIIQSAGRCNREGSLGPLGGRVIVFRPEAGGMPAGAYRTGAGVSQTLLSQGADLASDETPRKYFRELYEILSQEGLDREGIQRLRERLDYPAVADTFRMIDDDTESVAITTYGSEEQQQEARRLLDQLKRGAPEARLLMRRLQPYLVSVRHRQLRSFQAWLEPVRPGLWKWLGGYDGVRGINAKGLSIEECVV